MKGRTFASKAGLPPGGASKAAMALSYGYVSRPLPATGPWPVASMVKVGMGSADVVSVVGAAVVVAIDSMALEVVTVSRVTEESVVSTDESVAGAEVAAVTNVVVAIAVADSIDEASDVSVETTEVAADVAVKIGLQGLAATCSTANRPKATRKRLTERIMRSG